MFVRYIEENGSKVRTVECRDVICEPANIEDDPKLEKMSITIDKGTKSEMSIDVDCIRGNEFILMSDTGKTIDRKVW